jgi:uncharacterized protein
MEVSFQSQNCCFLAEFNDSMPARQIIKFLPFDSKVSLWGDEVYFKIGILAPGGEDTLDVKVGDIAYWPEAQCMCVFFGPTPSSVDGKPVPASPVVIIGKTSVSPDEFRKIQAGDPIRVIAVQKEPVAHTVDASASERKLSQAEIDVLVQQLLAQKSAKSQNSQ